MVFLSVAFGLDLTILQVHHGPNYVSTLKMFSTRTMSTECVNAQNARLSILLFDTLLIAKSSSWALI